MECTAQLAALVGKEVRVALEVEDGMCFTCARSYGVLTHRTGSPFYRVETVVNGKTVSRITFVEQAIVEMKHRSNGETFITVDVELNRHL